MSGLSCAIRKTIRPLWNSPPVPCAVPGTRVNYVSILEPTSNLRVAGRARKEKTK